MLQPQPARIAAPAPRAASATSVFEEEHSSEWADAVAGAAHHQQAGADQQQRERHEQGPRVREESIQPRLPTVSRKGIGRRRREAACDHLHYARDERRRSGIARAHASVEAKAYAFRDESRRSAEQKRATYEGRPSATSCSEADCRPATTTKIPEMSAQYSTKASRLSRSS
jgi:hypothetical protein